MRPIWIGILVGFIVVTISELIGYVNRRSGKPNLSSVSNAAAPPLSQRAQYWTLLFGFVIAPLLSAWIAGSISQTQIAGIALLIMAATWLVLGLAPVAIAASQGRESLSAFKSAIEAQSNASFVSLACIWTLAIVVAVIVSVRRLSG